MTKPAPKRILIVDDEETICEVLRFNLEAEGYEAEVAYSAEDVLAMNISRFDLILLDIMMDGISGTQLAGILKRNPVTAKIPIIFCTAKDAEDDMVNGLDMGADDYIVKPYSLRNIMARIRSVLRRTDQALSSASDTEERIEYCGLVVLPKQKMCMVDGNDVKLPKKEFEILCELMGHPGKIYSRDELLQKIWPDEVVVLDRVVDVNITRIRQKIGRYGKNIITRSGYGYGFIE